MYAGQVVESGTREEIFYHSQHPYTLALLGSVPKLEWKNKQLLQTIKGTPPDLISPPKGCAFAKRCNYCMNICLEEMPEITDFEAGHYTRCWLHHKEVPASVKNKFLDDRTKITVNETDFAADEGEKNE